jgi:hypothetical protein
MDFVRKKKLRKSVSKSKNFLIIHTYTYIHTYLCVYIYVHTCTCIYA